jgi:hypothetical protein
MPATVTGCDVCHGTRWIRYDENHRRRCDFCCMHPSGVWLLEEAYGEDNGKFCCRAGCGTTWDSPDDYYSRGL